MNPFSSLLPLASDENMTQLQQLSLTVDEPDDGDFFWTILESTIGHTSWTEHSSALHGYRTWKEAWNAGNVEYLKLVTDPRIGPRYSGAVERTAPSA